MVPDPLPQPVLAPLTPAAIFLVATIDDGGERRSTTRCPTSPGWFARSASAIRPSSCRWSRRSAPTRGTGCSADPPGRAAPVRRAPGLPALTRPSTPGDLLFHIRAESMDVCFELAGSIVDAMAGAVTVVDEVHGFRFFDNRDLMGFVDGTENPDGPIALSATQIGDEDPDFAGASYVHVQKYVHDMDSWNSLSSESRSGSSGAPSSRTSNSTTRSNRPTRTSRSTSSGRRRQRTEDRAPQHAVRRGGQGRVRHVLHRVSRPPAVTERMLRQHVHRRSAGQHRPNPRLLHRRDRRDVLHAHRRLPR